MPAICSHCGLASRTTDNVDELEDLRSVVVEYLNAPHPYSGDSEWWAARRKLKAAVGMEVDP
jgi:hypothetical protein